MSDFFFSDESFEERSQTYGDNTSPFLFHEVLSLPYRTPPESDGSVGTKGNDRTPDSRLPNVTISAANLRNSNADFYSPTLVQGLMSPMTHPNAAAADMSHLPPVYRRSISSSDLVSPRSAGTTMRAIPETPEVQEAILNMKTPDSFFASNTVNDSAYTPQQAVLGLGLDLEGTQVEDETNASIEIISLAQGKSVPNTFVDADTIDNNALNTSLEIYSPTTVEKTSLHSDESEDEINNMSEMFPVPISSDTDAGIGSFFNFDLFDESSDHLSRTIPKNNYMAALQNHTSVDSFEDVKLEPKRIASEGLKPKKVNLEFVPSLGDVRSLKGHKNHQSTSTLTFNVNTNKQESKSAMSTPTVSSKPSFSLSDCSTTFPVNSMNNWSFVMEHENVDHSKKKKIATKVDKPSLKRSTSASIFENSSQKSYGAPKVLQNMKSGMVLFQLQSSNNGKI